MNGGGAGGPDHYFNYYEGNITDDDELGVDPVLASILMAAVATISTAIQALAIITVRQNLKITRDLKMCFYVEHWCRIMILLEHIFWGIPCGLWNARQSVSPLVDHLVTYLYYCEFFVICLVQLMVSVNRFLAISFNGLYYQRVVVPVNRRLKFILVFVPPALLYSPLFVDAWCLPTFDPYFFSFSVYPIAKSRLVREYIFRYFQAISCHFLGSLWVIGTLIDGVVLFKVVMRFRARSNHKREVKLAIMTTINHFANAVGVVSMFMASLVWMDSLTLFILVTLVNLGLYGVFGLNVLIFLRERRSRAVHASNSADVMAVIS